MGVKTETEILLDLVTIPSVSNLSNQPVVNYALKFLHARAWNIERYPYSDAAGVEKVNLVARTGPDRTAELALVCHTDTVPFDSAWEDAVAPVVRKGRLYGRGSCDVKGFLACVLHAVSHVDLKRLTKPLAVVLTADEEVGCVGAKHLAERKAVRSRYTIVGEPTGLHPVRAGKGYALAQIDVRGKEAHSAFPDNGRSAIYDAARVVARLERLAAKIAARKNRDFRPPFTTLNVGLIQGGSAKNIVPGQCRIVIEWRPVPGQNPSWPADLIREELDQLRAKFPGLDAQLEVLRIDPPFEAAPTNRLSELLESLSGLASTTVSFGTEAAHLRSGAEETVVFGPGDMTVAHKSGEFVPIPELNLCAEYLKTVIEQLCIGK
jgi:acetylornithine deacetylase